MNRDRKRGAEEVEVEGSTSNILLPVVEGEGTSGTSGTSGTPGTSGTSGTPGPCIRLFTRAPSYTKPPRPEDERLYLSERLRQKPGPEFTKDPQTFDSLIIALNTMIKYNGEDEDEEITASEIVWDPPKEVIDKKIAASISKDYDLRCTDYFFDQIFEIRKEIHTWLLDNDMNRRKRYMKEPRVLVVDFANALSAAAANYDKLFDKLKEISSEFGCNVIILSIQNFNIDTSKFNSFTDRLKNVFDAHNIYILTAHNRGSGDDLNCVLTIELLRILGILYHFLTGDYLLDYKKFYKGYLRPIMLIPDITREVIDPYIRFAVPGRTQAKRNSELQKHMRTYLDSISIDEHVKYIDKDKEFQDFMRSLPPVLGYMPPIPEHSMPHVLGYMPPIPERDIGYRGDSRGGTKKNKKSLLSKYTRKIAHFKKVKTSHKKHKTTIKAHRKYSKKYKKHRTYKSKRL
jgi:hypothetical protein